MPKLESKKVDIPQDRIPNRVTVARKTSPEWGDNVAAFTALVEKHRATEARLLLGGGQKAYDKKIEAGLLPPRQRVQKLVDPGSP
ncbi:MAG: hypothetical protein HUU03_14870, partial [Planctomycetaceae bacterium]|nr:hypothetical protein [Planctomycetaceae bacterium]